MKIRGREVRVRVSGAVWYVAFLVVAAIIALIVLSCASTSTPQENCYEVAQARANLVVPPHDSYGRQLMFDRAFRYCLEGRDRDGRLRGLAHREGQTKNER